MCSNFLLNNSNSWVVFKTVNILKHAGVTMNSKVNTS